jgi:hypothetical protein
VNGVRLWIAILALISASAGFAGGLLVYGALDQPQAPEGPFADYEQLMVDEFNLSPERARLFRTVLASYKQERDAVRDRYEAESMSAMAPELARVDATYRDLIRNRVLQPEARPRYDRLVLGPAAEPR